MRTKPSIEAEKRDPKPGPPCIFRPFSCWKRAFWGCFVIVLPLARDTRPKPQPPAPHPVVRKAPQPCARRTSLMARVHPPTTRQGRRWRPATRPRPPLGRIPGRSVTRTRSAPPSQHALRFVIRFLPSAQPEIIPSGHPACFRCSAGPKCVLVSGHSLIRSTQMIRCITRLLPSAQPEIMPSGRGAFFHGSVGPHGALASGLRLLSGRHRARRFIGFAPRASRP